MRLEVLFENSTIAPKNRRNMIDNTKPIELSIIPAIDIPFLLVLRPMAPNIMPTTGTTMPTTRRALVKILTIPSTSEVIPFQEPVLAGTAEAGSFTGGDVGASVGSAGDTTVLSAGTG
jgi:hypothetical protein